MSPQAPVALLAELTYRCPLRCGYCSNPTDWGRYSPELATKDWLRVIHQAADLGVLHLHFSGGEPLLRDDLETLVSAARDAGLYVNLITSAWGLTEARVGALARAGVDHIQVSFQDVDAARGDLIAGTAVHAHKIQATRWVKAHGLALSVNVVLHRGNLDRIGEIIALAASTGAERLELANTQFHGNGLTHRPTLMPTRAQLDHGAAVAAAARDRLRGTLDVLWVLPDHYTDTPKPCMDGWGRRFITVIPTGAVLPCPGAHGLPGMAMESVTTRSLADIWHAGPDFQRFRGTDWMSPTCAGCDRRDVDHGGCRCQAWALTGDPAATDPACARSPHHDLVRAARGESMGPAAVLYRLDTSRRRTAG